MNTETWISYNFHVLWNIILPLILFQLFLKCKQPLWACKPHKNQQQGSLLTSDMGREEGGQGQDIRWAERGQVEEKKKGVYGG